MDYTTLSLNDIKNMIFNLDIEEKKKFCTVLQEDKRKGAINIVLGLKKEINDYNREINRIYKMKEFENRYFKKGVKYIAGIDEVGRGPLAGPVYASAVVFPAECIIEGVDDSKKLSASRRSQLYTKIKECSICVATGSCSEKVIDQINILNATYMAMKDAVLKLKIRPEVLLIDAIKIPGIDILQVPIIKGDSLSFSIAAASIVAKVERDEYMNKLDIEYPAYNFKNNKGYGTAEHITAIKEHGICPSHRRTFVKNFVKP